MSCLDLGALAPELVLAGAALALVPLAAFANGRWRALPTAVAAAALAAMVALGALRLAAPPRAVFCGTYAVDGLAGVFRIVLGVAAMIALAALHAHLRGTGKEGHAAAALCFATLGGVLATGSLDLALILLFLQLLSMASYVLVGIVRTDPGGNEAALKAFLFGAVALAVMAYGLSFVFGLTGSLSLPDIRTALAGEADPVWLAVALGLVLIGYAFEATIVPLHAWAPDVYEGAPAPVAGFVSVVPKVAGLGALARFVLTGLPREAVGWPTLLALLAALTMTLGNLAALRQERLKRLLAYSSIAQAGYVLVAIAAAGRSAAAGADAGSAEALSAAAFYLAAYAFMNLGAFTLASQLERATGGDALRSLRGLGRAAPAPVAGLALSLLSLAGIPPLAGFAGKVLVFRAGVDAGLAWLVILAAANMAVGLYVYLRPIARLYLEEPAATPPRLPLRAGFVAALGASVVGSLVLGIAPDTALRVTRYVAAMVGAPGG